MHACSSAIQAQPMARLLSISAAKRVLEAEAAILSQLNHPNVVQLIGTVQTTPAMLVFEYMRHGSLDKVCACVPVCLSVYGTQPLPHTGAAIASGAACKAATGNGSHAVGGQRHLSR